MRVASILGVPVHNLNLVGAQKLVTEWAASRKRPPAVIVHTNAYTMVTAQEVPDYLQSLQNADLSLPDGMPVVWLLRHAGYDQKDRVYGPDLMLLLCEAAATEGWRCFLYGGRPGIPEKVADKLLSLYPSLRIVGTYSPPFRELTESEDEEIVRMINNTAPDILWVALGGPKQDSWMLRNRERLNVSVMHGVGAAFDFLAGVVPQAPRWMMNAGLEWLFRLLAEPRRLWKRYTVKNAKFLYFILSRGFKGTQRRGWIKERAG